jgi:hypothetical protein
MKNGEHESNQPEISEETKKKMVEFFLKTSIPRILAEKTKAINQEKRVN